MKKLIALLLSLMMLLPLAACAEGAFSYKAEDFANTLAEMYDGSIEDDKNGCITVNVANGLPVLVTYDAKGMCTGLSTELLMSANGDADEGGTKFGLSGIAVLLVSALMENNGDMSAIVDETQEALDGFTKLLTEILIESEVLLEYGHDAGTMTVCGHPCTLTANFNTSDMSISVKLEYLP